MESRSTAFLWILDFFSSKEMRTNLLSNLECEYSKLIAADLTYPNTCRCRNPGLLSSSVPSARNGKFSSRLQCLSLGCPKTFSNVSNRNKHMREGCTVREHKGYKCRNEGCAKVLTTKWYRNTHEQTRCRYRYEVSGNQFCWMEMD